MISKVLCVMLGHKWDESICGKKQFGNDGWRFRYSCQSDDHVCSRCGEQGWYGWSYSPGYIITKVICFVVGHNWHLTTRDPSIGSPGNHFWHQRYVCRRCGEKGEQFPPWPGEEAKIRVERPRSQKEKRVSTSRIKTSETFQPLSSRQTFTESDKRRRKELEAQGWTGRTNPELDALNRKLTNSLSANEIRRRVREREAAGLPTGQLRAAARDRGIDLD